MAKIIAPNKSYTGISASVAFCNGIAETENPTLVDWFKKHGYEVEEEKAEEEIVEEETAIDKMTIEELKTYAEERGIDLGKSTSQEGILKKIKDVEYGE
ncbi:hypothetical protein SAMN02745248_02409 [Hathewaya proteolytica DSM 3090]|uniref:Rho termination factor, N-terminal domain n=1 Tax=Hathewaya proteolytica DSM 3090 TaxID=1121331 RepID=A0A1M6S0B7_9CLOT|nr:hypothetical protein [Hathewaya proteolytica]SHK38115.1 hypothetical protein SAMN02745248_02409 [Hathewaya proteolytica DSM 3090]